jgi:hypothetical protein
MKNRFFGKFDPDVQKRKKQERDVENKFIRNLDTYCQVGITGGGNIDKREFDGFMKCWAFSCENEREFLMRLVECFRLSQFSQKYGIHGTVGNEVNQGWRKEWGRQKTEYQEEEKEKKSTWGNFTQGKEEIYHSRRGKSAYGRERFDRRYSLFFDFFVIIVLFFYVVVFFLILLCFFCYLCFFFFHYLNIILYDTFTLYYIPKNSLSYQ